MEAAYQQCAKTASYYELHQGLQPFVYWHVTESVQEGYNPEAIGELQPEVEVEALVLERRSIARDHALGLFVSLLYYYLARQSDPADVDAAINALLADFDKHLGVGSFADFQLDTADIYEYIEEQRQNAGLIADDPDWHQQAKTSASMQWPVVFKKSLELTRLAYVEACHRFEHHFALGSQADAALLQLLTNHELARLASRAKAQPRHVPAAPPSATIDTATAAGYWAKRTGQKPDDLAKVLPEFDPNHLIHAGQQFRAACLDHVRAQQSSESGKDINAVLSEAINSETNPQRLVERAGQLWTPQTATSSWHAAADDNEATLIKNAKDLLSSALRILGTRDSERNVSLRIDAYNLRGHINRRLATLKPHHQANYLNRAVDDWSASAELDADQNDIIDLLAQIKNQLESVSDPIPARSDDERKTSSENSNPSKQSLRKDSGKRSSLQPSASVQLSAGSPAKGSSSDIKQKNVKDASVGSGGEGGTIKPRDKTILESPFFRSDLVTGLMVDSLLNLAFPHRALRETLRFPSAASVSAISQDYVPLLDQLAKAHHQTTKGLTPENKAQLQTAVKTVSTVLALPDLQRATRDDAAGTLRKTSLQLVLGTLFLLLNDLVKAQTELELVSNALKPNNTRGVGRGAALNTSAARAAATEADSATEARAAEQTTLHMQARVQGQTLLLLAKSCWMANKVQEATKFFRWFVKWYSEQQAQRVTDRRRGGEGADRTDAAEVELDQIDMGWWDRVVVVTKA
ncbi:hypothetical protein EX895_001202 [Sporisorium graminicola]|uniref:Uncharacterized protein n=1 Tax=Sporisorium graminicola TaxID=280036 RepID=A0A4U7KYF3_9BASI|nr:hypothetical protein EX895_001202 [Sporisorium graminicola]TKY89905.1 hypothetical protein EX895_001202 [Sporisorium graminicola]